MIDLIPKRFGQAMMAVLFAVGFFPPESYVLMGVALLGFAIITCMPVRKQ